MYHQLTLEKRYTLYVLKQEGLSMRSIAELLGVHASSISREFHRNKSGKGYRHNFAHRLAINRRKICRKPAKLTPEVKQILRTYLNKRWSPEQISGRLMLEGIFQISHETIYKYIRQNKESGGKLYKYLRRKRKYRKKYGSLNRHKLSNRVSIDKRPEIVDQKCRIGDWEIDTIIPSSYNGPVLLSIVERFSKYLFLGKVKSKDATLTARKTIELFFKHKEKVLTITSDNGREFFCHKVVSNLLNVDFYFAHPYKSWERGLNENTNGLIREYFPKKTTFESITYDRLLQVTCNINNRPRKTLGYKTPREVFFSEGVALQG